jgi:methionine synthase II (cobalamin-independent)
MNPNFPENELQLEGFSHTPTDYYRGTVMEPSATSTLRPSFGEYDAMGERHEAISRAIADLGFAMKLSRQRGAFQELQRQMAATKKLVKEREEIDGKMATLDLARKNNDDHNIAAGMETSYSERIDSMSTRIDRLQELLHNFKEPGEVANRK